MNFAACLIFMQSDSADLLQHIKWGSDLLAKLKLPAVFTFFKGIRPMDAVLLDS